MHPVLFHLGPFPIYTYGFLVALGVLASVQLMRRNSAREGWTPDEVLDLTLLFVFSSFLGARTFYVLNNWDYYSGHLFEIVAVWQGGIVFYGGSIGGLLFLIYYSRRKKWPYFQITDFLAPYTFLAHAFGRIGCFFNGCCYGKPADVPWAVHYPFLPHAVHPTQLYESAFNLTMFPLLISLHRRKKFHGETTLLYFLIYGLGRFVLEIFRGDNPPVLAGLTISQVLSVAFVLSVAAAYYLYFRKKAPGVKKETDAQDRA